MKIAIIGFSGSGKSTLARELGQFFNIPVLHLDTVQFLPGWNERELVEKQAIVGQFLKENSDWVIDGNYSNILQEERFQAATQIIFMNFSRWRCFYRIVNRYRQNRNQTRVDMAKGCNEKLDFEFAWWVLHKGRNTAKQQHFAKMKQTYPDKWVEIKTSQELKMFLKKTKLF